jgi:hypothetical protein
MRYIAFAVAGFLFLSGVGNILIIFMKLEGYDPTVNAIVASVTIGLGLLVMWIALGKKKR